MDGSKVAVFGSKYSRGNSHKTSSLDQKGMYVILAAGDAVQYEAMAMSNRTLERLRTEALDLPQADRAELAHDLVKSLDGPADPTVVSAWDEEILRRLDEVEAGTAKTVDREEFAKRMRERISRL